MDVDDDASDKLSDPRDCQNREKENADEKAVTNLMDTHVAKWDITDSAPGERDQSSIVDR